MLDLLLLAHHYLCEMLCIKCHHGSQQHSDYRLWQVTGVPIIFVSALEGRGRASIMRHVNESYRKWCARLPTAKLNRWLRKVLVPSDLFRLSLMYPPSTSRVGGGVKNNDDQFIGCLCIQAFSSMEYYYPWLCLFLF